MRLIDADALIEKTDSLFKALKSTEVDFMGIGYNHGVGDCIAIAKNIPTIEAEPVKRGRWEITEAYPHNVHCSVCHKLFAQTHWTVWEDGSLPRTYCPNCGARMEREE